jgi:hypothetical protein
MLEEAVAAVAPTAVVSWDLPADHSVPVLRACAPATAGPTSSS